ncbi:MAG: GH3 auxin-responsive promoter family protein [Candidatus Sericytochromatia bacterium]|nr:GH3 auxin-responsive promoter family protein [Candidatus Sericytochromatia bacterium]
MGILGPLSQFLRRKYVKRFEAACAQPEVAQWHKLEQILKANAQTAYGQAHGFDQIDSISAYQAKTPIVTHVELKPWLDRMIQGEKNILTHQEPLFYGMTTGSTGPPKLTPITPDYRDEYQSVVQVFLAHIYTDHPAAFNGKVLYFNGSADKMRTPTGVPCGTMSGFNFVNLPPLLKKFYAVPYEVMVIDHNWTRHYITALLSLPQKVSMMLGITAAPMVALLQFMQENLPLLAHDLEMGTLHPDLVLSAEERALISRLHKANPATAKHLRQLLAGGETDPKSLWPGLELLVCWKSSHAGSLIPALEKFTNKKVPIRDAIYSATEGWCNVPLSDTTLGGPLALQAHFYEFIPENAQGQSPILLAHELKQGERYRILYTTSSGIYRYDIGDILEVSGFYKRNPVVHFIRKAGQTCNLVGELMTDYHITMAVQAVSQATAQAGSLESEKAELPFYIACPDVKAFPPRYRLLAEPSQSLTESQVQTLAFALDKALQGLNCDYKASRSGDELGPLQLEILPPGSEARFRQARVAAGADEAQLKPLVLVADPARLDVLLAAQK